MRKPSVIFDFDGTLADATDILLASFKHFGYAIDENSRELLGNIGWKHFCDELGISKDERAKVVKIVCDHAADSGNIPIMEGVHDILEALKPSC